MEKIICKEADDIKTWTEDEVNILKANYNSATNKELSRLLPSKTPYAIYKKAYKLGFRKSKEIEFLNRSEATRRENSANWKGGVRMTKKGYKQVLHPEHPRADSAGYVMEHIFVWEQETGVSVPPDCCIHHINGNKCDNRIENLCMMKHSAHTVLHHQGAKRSENTKKNISNARRKKYA